jgi:hypothetical protein
VQDDGVYLIENGLEMILYIGQQVPPMWLQQVMGKDSFASIETQGAVVPTLDSPLNQAVRRALDLVRQERGRFMPVSIQWCMNWGILSEQSFFTFPDIDLAVSPLCASGPHCQAA